MTLWLLAVATAVAGYGDASGGFPLPNERAMHVWTNAVRMDPAAFASSYACRFEDWPRADRTPQPPLGLDGRLNEAARAHSADMAARGYFAHEDPQGVDPFDRMDAVGYPFVMAGENIQMGAPEGRGAVMGWMCSPGHRENIMVADFHDMGPGYAPGPRGPLWTQKFGATGAQRRVPALAMGAHEPRGAGVLLLVSVGARAAPEAVYAVVDGTPVEMTLGSGDPAQGTWRVSVEAEPGCHAYWFEAEIGADRPRFPEDGAYTFGACGAGEVDDEAAGWIGSEAVRSRFGAPSATPSGGGDPGGVGDRGGGARETGCGGADVRGGGALAALWGLLPALIRRQRRGVAAGGPTGSGSMDASRRGSSSRRRSRTEVRHAPCVSPTT